MKRSILINLGILICVVFAYLTVQKYQLSFSSKNNSLNLSSVLDSTELLDLKADGLATKIKLDKPTIINFFASWCPNCKKEKPWLAWLKAQIGTSAQLVGVASYDQLSSFNPQNTMDYTYSIFLDSESRIAESIGISEIPQTLLVGVDGKVHRWVKGPLNQSKSQELLQTIEKINSVKRRKNNLYSFQLTDDNGKPFKFASKLEGQFWVADFIFTSCQMECPVLTQKMKKIQRHFPNNPKLQLLSVSVDPENDTPERLREYRLEQKVPDSASKWSFLTGDKEQLTKVINEGFRIGQAGELIFHSEKFVLGEGDRIIGYFDSNDPADLRKLVTKITSLLGRLKVSVK